MEPAVSGDDLLVGGMDSYLNPQKLPAGFYQEGMNVVNRGGIVKTRPGSRTINTLPDGRFQGLTMFTPTGGAAHLVFAVGGYVYVSRAPFTSYVRLYNITFSNTSTQIAWAVCVKTTYIDQFGEQQFLDEPYSVLVMQDGVTRAAYWDGTNSGHLDPSATPAQTAVGLWMKWSNNRLWVSRNNQIFASDIGDPLSFTETQYINEGRAFYLPEDCTGIAETSDQQGILCFGPNTGTFIQTSIQDRELWLSTPSFQKTILPGIGCVSHRSIVQQYGLLWWYSQRGLISLNDALKAFITSRIDTKDNEMFSTKRFISYDMTGVAGISYENFLLESVPAGDKFNTRTLVMDQSPLQDSDDSAQTFGNCWSSFWTGWRPVEWAMGAVDGNDRVFFGSVDYDGKNRIWEAFTPDLKDNGCPITCYVATREHLFDNRDFKQFVSAEVEFRELAGDVSVMLAVAGVRGAYQTLGKKEIVATVGQAYADELYGNGENNLGDSMPQTRLVKTQNSSEPSDCNSECIESEIRGLIDKAFSLLVVWSGIAGVGAYRIFSRPYAQTYEGACETNETGSRLLTAAGCGELAKFSEKTPFETYTSTKTYTLDGVSRTSTQTSSISQEDADRKATLAAQNYVLAQIGQLV